MGVRRTGFSGCAGVSAPGLWRMCNIRWPESNWSGWFHRKKGQANRTVSVRRPESSLPEQPVRSALVGFLLVHGFDVGELGGVLGAAQDAENAPAEQDGDETDREN